MTSKNGTRKWNPACLTPANRPRRSTTYALCCGTTTAVLATMMSTTIGETMPTTMTGLDPSAGSFGFDVQHQAIHADDAAARAASERHRAGVARRPCRAAQLDAADGRRREFLAAMPISPTSASTGRQPADRPETSLQEAAAEERQSDHRQAGKQQQLHPYRAGQAEGATAGPRSGRRCRRR